jgi:DNA polymerase-4
VLRLRFGDYTRASRSHTLAIATGEPAAIASAACRLLDAAMPAIDARGVTLLGLTVTNLVDTSEAGQLALPVPDEAG